jgi:hypothetical protein
MNSQMLVLPLAKQGGVRGGNRMGSIPTIALLLMLLGSEVGKAGGPLGASGTTPRRYALTAFPLRYHTDLGTLGALTNATAVSIAQYAFQQWDNVSSAQISFIHGGSLARDVVSATDPYISGSTQFSDGINPIVFDANGSITDAKLGVGANRSVIGFAGSAYTGNTYIEGYAIINGTLTGTGTTTDIDKYRATMTHEIGHFLGLGHSQVAMHADYATMYPTILKNAQRILQPDDTTAIANLYPTAAFQTGTGSISGTVRRPAGTNLSGVNVIAMNTTTGAAYSTVVDYFSGGKSGFDLPPAATGTYTFSGLQPGSYWVRIEPINAAFTGGSSIGSYNTPINTAINREWWNTAESGDMLTDNTNEHTTVTVTAGTTRSGVNFIHNESNTTTVLVHHNGTPTYIWPLPQGTISRYATRYTAPSSGTLVGVQLRLDPNSNLPTNGTMTIAVHANATGSLAGIPGALLGSVTVPYSELASDMFNEIYLRHLGSGVSFTAGQQFHIVISTNGVGQPILYTDNGSPTQNRSSYFNGTWQNWPAGGYGAGYNLIMSAVYSSQATVTAQPGIALSPTSIDFGQVRTRSTLDRTVRITNTGTGTLNVSGMSILGRDSVDFVIVSGGGSFSLAPSAFRDVVLRFQPCDPGGIEGPTKSAKLMIASNAPTSPNYVSLVGMAVEPAPLAVVSPIAFDCARPGGTYMMSNKIIVNAGLDTLRISGVEIMSDDIASPFKVMTPEGAVNVPPDSALEVTFSYAPTGVGTHAAFFKMNHDAYPAHTMIQMAGQSCAGVAQIQPSIDFGARAIATVHDTMVTIVNAGNDALTITSARVESMFGAESGTFFQLVDPLPITIAAGDTMTLRVQFMPSRGEGVYSGTLFLETNSFPDTTIVVSLAAVAVSTSSVEIAVSTEMIISPNPASDKISISGIETGERIALVDATGRELEAWRFDGSDLDVSRFSSGTYYLRIRDRPQKLVIQR